MTEGQAKARWCPFSRVVAQNDEGTSPASGNRVVDSEGPGLIDGSLCIGSKCMAWRVKSGFLDPMSSGVGYCGLAGRPE